MRPLGPLVTLCAFSLCCAWAQTQKRTEAQIYGFQGPVEIAITDVEDYGIEFEQPEGPGIVSPAGIRDLEFDHYGNMTKAGEILPTGDFFGDIIQNIYSDDGQITKRIHTDFASGQSSVVLFGPFGPTQSGSYISGKFRVGGVWTYSDNGLLTDSAILDANGTVLQERLIRKSDEGRILEEATWGHEGGGGDIFYERIDNEEDTHFFARWGNDGRLRLQSSTMNGKVVSFWSATGEPNQWGSISTGFRDHANAIRTSCNKGGACITSQVHYEFTDATEREPKSAEWTDSDGKIVYAAYYEYVYDSQQNWIRREVRIVSPHHPDPTLYETDSRTITYWER